MADQEQKTPKASVQRINGYLRLVTPVMDKTGKVIGHVTRPFMVEVRKRDIMQMIIGASILAVPVAFTEEVWNLGVELPLANVLALASISLLFIAAFVYFNFYRFHFSKYNVQFYKRVLGIYLVSLIVVGILMTLIQRCPWGVDNLLAIKRIIIVSFPASMSAAVSDMLK